MERSRREHSSKPSSVWAGTVLPGRSGIRRLQNHLEGRGAIRCHHH
uniref:Uncharacterized protein n=1 Tax=Anguilla anguilla TaxID=7936 RepID=A0A0E9UIM8_ANGAN